MTNLENNIRGFLDGKMFAISKKSFETMIELFSQLNTRGVTTPDDVRVLYDGHLQLRFKSWRKSGVVNNFTIYDEEVIYRYFDTKLINPNIDDEEYEGMEIKNIQLNWDLLSEVKC